MANARRFARLNSRSDCLADAARSGDIIVCGPPQDEGLPVPEVYGPIAGSTDGAAVDPRGEPCGASISGHCYSGVDLPQLFGAAIGVVGLITPWNWPMNQVTLKVIPALLAGCTCILKPSEESPLSSMLFAEFVHDAGVPAGVFNLVNGDGMGVGSQLSTHEDVAMISFTGSTRAGKAISVFCFRAILLSSNSSQRCQFLDR